MRLIDLLKEAKIKEENLINESKSSKSGLRKQTKIANMKKAREARKLKKQMGPKLEKYKRNLAKLMMKKQVGPMIDYIMKHEDLRKYFEYVIEARGRYLISELQQIRKEHNSPTAKFMMKLIEEFKKRNKQTIDE